MLPGSFQMPAAVILVVGGLCSCFAGYRIFRFVLAFFGFVFGALFVSSAMGSDQTLWMVGASLLGGAIGALILYAAYFVGVALIGAGIGAGLAMVLWAAVNREPGILPVIVFAVVGAAELMTRGATTSRSTFHVYPFDPLPGTRWDLVAFVVLAALGLVVQLRTSSKRKS